MSCNPIPSISVYPSYITKPYSIYIPVPRTATDPNTTVNPKGLEIPAVQVESSHCEFTKEGVILSFEPLSTLVLNLFISIQPSSTANNICEPLEMLKGQSSHADVSWRAGDAAGGTQMTRDYLVCRFWQLRAAKRFARGLRTSRCKGAKTCNTHFRESLRYISQTFECDECTKKSKKV